MLEYDSPPKRPARKAHTRSQIQEELRYYTGKPLISSEVPMENIQDPTMVLEDGDPLSVGKVTGASTVTSLKSNSEVESFGLDLEVISLPPGDEGGSRGGAGGAVSMVTGEAQLPAASSSSLPERQEEDGEGGTDTGDTMSTSEQVCPFLQLNLTP